jgi:hypothetical protein
MSQNDLNNFFFSNEFESPNELYCPSSSRYELENEINYSNGHSNLCERNTNELTNDEKNNNVEDEKDEYQIYDKQCKTKEKKLLGRKKYGEDNSDSNHTKYSDDNSRRKIKRIVVNELQTFINKRIGNIYGIDVGVGLTEKRLMKLRQNQISDASVEFNLKFLNKTLKDIFSEDVTGRITNYSPDRNKEVIEELINEEDVIKKEYFEGLFNLTFLDCLKYFRDDDIDEQKLQYLQGFPKFNEIKEELCIKSDENYVEHLSKYLNDYEKILSKKKPRKGKKEKKMGEN